MKIQNINTNNISKSEYKFIKQNIKDNKFIGNKEYKPGYYKTNVSFKGKVFESYFPSDIFQMNEENFDKFIADTIENNKKKEKLANYIVSVISQKNCALDFINMWKKQIPNLITPGMISVGGNSGAGAINKGINIATRNTVNSTMDKFGNSEYKDDILLKDTKSVVGGILIHILYNSAHACPEPTAKAGLYACAAFVSYMTYEVNRADSKKIQNKQFSFAIKECMRLGHLDPYNLLSYMEFKLPNNFKMADYEKWAKNNKEKIAFMNNMNKQDLKNIFDSTDAKSVFNTMSFLLSQELKLDNNKMVEFIKLFAKQYEKEGKIKEAEYVYTQIKDFQEGLFKIQKNENEVITDYDSMYRYEPLFETYTALAKSKIKNEKYFGALESFAKAETIAKNVYGETSKQVFDTNIKMLECIQSVKQKNDEIIPYLKADEEVSIGENRKSHNNDLYENLKRYNQDEEPYYPKEKTEKIFNITSEKIFNNLLNLMQKEPSLRNGFEKVLDIVEKYPNRKIYSIILDKSSQKELTSSFLPQIVNKNLPILYESTKKSSQDKSKEIKKMLIYNILSGDHNSANVVNNIIQTYGENSDEHFEIEKSVSDWLSTMDEYKDDYIYQRLNCPNYISVLEEVMYATGRKYGYNNDKTMNAVIKYLSSLKSYTDAENVISAFHEHASEETKQKYSAKIYETYADIIAYHLYHDPSNFYDHRAKEGILAYKKVLNSTKTPNPLLVYKYLDFLDKLNKYHVNDNTPFMSLDETPLIHEYENLSKEEQVKNFYICETYTNWPLHEDDLKELVQSAPGPYRINERKYLQMMKKNETVFFQKQFDKKMDSQLYRIENNVQQYEIK